MPTSHDTTIVKDIAYQLAPPPVRPGDQETEYAFGDALLVEFNPNHYSFGGVERTIVISQVSTGRYGTMYAIRFYDDNGNFLKRSVCGIGEATLKAAFRSYIWWLK